MKYSSIGTLLHLLGGPFATALETLRAQEDVQQMQIGVFASADLPRKGDDERQRLRLHKKTSPAAGAGKANKEGAKKSKKKRIKNSASPTVALSPSVSGGETASSPTFSASPTPAGKAEKGGAKKSGKSRKKNSASPTVPLSPRASGGEATSPTFFESPAPTMGKAGKTTAESTKSKKSKKSKSAKRAKRRMPSGSPTRSASVPGVEAPTNLPTTEDTTAPTSTPPGAIYYNSFETGSFGPEWSVTTSDNEDSTGDSRGRSLEEEEPLTPPSYWTLTTEEAFTGVYSIKSPDLSNDDFTRRSANVTLTSDIPEAGYLTFSILSGLNYPADDLIWYVDGVFYDYAPLDSSGWLERQIMLEEGTREVTWKYVYNSLGYAEILPDVELEPSFIDDVYFTPSTVNYPTFRPTESAIEAPTLSPSAIASPTESPTPIWPTYFPSNSPTVTLASLVPSPNCIGDGYTCLQNINFGVEDTSKYNIDLSLEVRDPKNADAYLSARAKWMELIVGDLPSFASDKIGNADDCVNNFPANVDDLHICARDAEIDGPGGILGQAAPSWGRNDDVTGKLTTVVTGGMVFDIADVEMMVADGTWESVILHEMGHVLGIGTIWGFTGLVNANLDYLGEHAISVWVDDWGCASSAPPVDKDGGDGTAGSHWDEGCLKTELMTGFAEVAGTDMPVSTLTIATLQDMGYTVDYDAADDYDGSDTTCCFSSSGIDSIVPSQPSKPPLSDIGRATAVAYGRKVLSENQRPPSIVDEELDSPLVYLGDLFTVILMEENGHIYDVHVTKE